MVITLDMKSSIPIYVQMRNQIVKGIGMGELKAGEKLPTVRALAADAGVNTMTVNKAYQILKTEGFIDIDRRKGAVVCPVKDEAGIFKEKLEKELELLCAEACLKGIKEPDFLKLCGEVFGRMSPEAVRGCLQ